MNEHQDLQFIAAQSGTTDRQAKNVMDLLNEGMTVPFISRYRKERTQNLDETVIEKIREWQLFIDELNQRKETVLKTISQLEKLTPVLEKKIIQTYSKTELEDLYLPFKPKRRTRATIARERGLEPLSVLLLDSRRKEPGNILARPYINSEMEIHTIEDALSGAGDIIAEQYAENAEFRQKIRMSMVNIGLLTVNVTDKWKEKRSKYEQYYQYQEPVRSIPSHRFLAIRRGQGEKVLKVQVDMDREKMILSYGKILIPPSHPRTELLKTILMDSLNRLILPSIETDVLSEIKIKADQEAIDVFASNMEKLLLTPPAGGRCVIGVDPGFRTGAKLVVLDATGTLLHFTTIYPVKPKEDVKNAQKTVEEILKKFPVEAIAVGNGTASRETFHFFKKFLPDNIIITMVNEAGASIYSASQAGREEFPDQDVTVRGAVSIGRRFQDPLSELVKIDPKSIGVGQYQHDVNQNRLKDRLDSTVSSVVNRVGVDLNTASRHILKYVSGIGESLAKNIVSFRLDNGPFSHRTQLQKVPKFGEKAFLQSAGFLRIREGKNPMDMTGIHPETYFIVDTMSKHAGISTDELIRNEAVLNNIVPDQFTTENFGLPTIRDILNELRHPGRDPRKDFDPIEFSEDVQTIEDLREGMVLNGIVTNVTRFGAFVDIGVHQEGLIHVSQLAHKYIKNPEEVIGTGEKVKVKVLSVDLELKRIQLSLKALQPRPSQGRSKPKKDNLKGRQNKWKPVG